MCIFTPVGLRFLASEHARNAGCGAAVSAGAEEGKKERVQNEQSVGEGEGNKWNQNARLHAVTSGCSAASSRGGKAPAGPPVSRASAVNSSCFLPGKVERGSCRSWPLAFTLRCLTLVLVSSLLPLRPDERLIASCCVSAAPAVEFFPDSSYRQSVS